jgi:hypothetical protein
MAKEKVQTEITNSDELLVTMVHPLEIVEIKVHPTQIAGWEKYGWTVTE